MDDQAGGRGSSGSAGVLLRLRYELSMHVCYYRAEGLD
jgi:hypothetical protein